LRAAASTIDGCMNLTIDLAVDGTRKDRESEATVAGYLPVSTGDGVDRRSHTTACLHLLSVLEGAAYAMAFRFTKSMNALTSRPV
jgi:hypothetical protein